MMADKALVEQPLNGVNASRSKASHVQQSPTSSMDANCSATVTPISNGSINSPSETISQKINGMKAIQYNGSAATSAGNKNHRNGKLGSDGESEASPETSLSPVDVDSFEEELATDSSSPTGSAASNHPPPPYPAERKKNINKHLQTTSSSTSTSSSSSQLLQLVCEALDNETSVDTESGTFEVVIAKHEPRPSSDGEEDQSFVSGSDTSRQLLLSENPAEESLLSGCVSVAGSSLVESNGLVVRFDEVVPLTTVREENLLSTVIEEEPDSLEEFIQAETACGCSKPPNGLSGGNPAESQSSAAVTVHQPECIGNGNSSERVLDLNGGDDADEGKQTHSSEYHFSPSKSSEDPTLVALPVIITGSESDDQPERKLGPSEGISELNLEDSESGEDNKKEISPQNFDVTFESGEKAALASSALLPPSTSLPSSPSSAPSTDTFPLNEDQREKNQSKVATSPFFKTNQEENDGEKWLVQALDVNDGQIIKRKVKEQDSSSRQVQSEKESSVDDDCEVGHERVLGDQKRIHPHDHHINSERNKMKLIEAPDSGCPDPWLNNDRKPSPTSSPGPAASEATIRADDDEASSTFVLRDSGRNQENLTCFSTSKVLRPPPTFLEVPDVVTHLTFEPIASLVSDLSPVDENVGAQTPLPDKPPTEPSPVTNGYTKHPSKGMTSHANGVHGSKNGGGGAKDHISRKKQELTQTTFKRSSSIKDLRDKQNEAEVMIAREIIELKHREEELKIMRQEMARIQALRMTSGSKDSPIDGNKGSAVPSDVSSVEIEGRCSPSSSEISTTDSVSGRRSVDSLESSNCSSSSSGVGHKINRLNRIKVKPFEDKEEVASSAIQPPFSKMTESPIEREIRITKEREEELRREKFLRINQTSSVISNGDKDVTLKSGEPNSNPDDTMETDTAMKKGTNTANIQKVLATTRIQQEIEEQTQREMALRASGSIKTISHERTDKKVVPTQMAPSVPSPCSPIPAVDVKSIKETLKNGVTNGKVNHQQSKEDVEKKSNNQQEMVVNGANTNGSEGIKSRQGNLVASRGQTSLSSSPSLPLSAGINITQLPSSVRKSNIASPIFGYTKNISMHKFISSKGKSGCLQSSSPNSYKQFGSHQNLSSVGNSCGNDHNGYGNGYRELRPPVFSKKETIENGRRRGSVTAETKIIEELKEMKAREEELRNQRILVRSQSNLLLIGTDSERSESTASSDSKTRSGSRGVSHRMRKPNGALKRTSSLSALLSSDAYDANDDEYDHKDRVNDEDVDAGHNEPNEDRKSEEVPVSSRLAKY